jgi:hypothetical protein
MNDSSIDLKANFVADAIADSATKSNGAPI